MPNIRINRTESSYTFCRRVRVFCVLFPRICKLLGPLDYFARTFNSFSNATGSEPPLPSGARKVVDKYAKNY